MSSQNTLHLRNRLFLTLSNITGKPCMSLHTILQRVLYTHPEMACFDYPYIYVRNGRASTLSITLSLCLSLSLSLSLSDIAGKLHVTELVQVCQ